MRRFAGRRSVVALHRKRSSNRRRRWVCWRLIGIAPGAGAPGDAPWHPLTPRRRLMRQKHCWTCPLCQGKIGGGWPEKSGLRIGPGYHWGTRGARHLPLLRLPQAATGHKTLPSSRANSRSLCPKETKHRRFGFASLCRAVVLHATNHSYRFCWVIEWP